ncbi:MAG: hypothetical protein JNK87_08010 [Bryobacterales bacterium]|nr:hypothetical protein [Bryobacterales bacterium]
MLDIIKLAGMQQLVNLGVPIRIAANFGPMIELALWREDIDEIEQGRVQRVPMLVAVEGEQLKLLFWRPIPTIAEGISSEHETDVDPMAAMASLGHRAAYVLDWASIVDDVMEKLEAKVE